MNKKTQTQEWFLIKKNWKEWILDLSMEERGQLLTALYTNELPEGLLGTLFKSHIEEFDRVNAKAREAKKQRQSKAVKAAQARWGDTKGMLKHAKEVLDDAKSTKNTMLEHTEAMHSDAGTVTKTITDTDTITVINNVDVDRPKVSWRKDSSLNLKKSSEANRLSEDDKTILQVSIPALRFGLKHPDVYGSKDLEKTLSIFQDFLTKGFQLSDKQNSLVQRKMPMVEKLLKHKKQEEQNLHLNHRLNQQYKTKYLK